MSQSFSVRAAKNETFRCVGAARVRLFLVPWCHRSLSRKCHILLT